MTTATMATPAKAKNENVSLRTFLEKNGIGGRLGNGLVMDPTHLNIIPGFNTRTAGLGEAYWELPEVKDHLARLAQQYADSPLEMAPMVVQVRDGQVVIRQGHCRHRAIPLANKIRAERGEGPVDKIRVDEFRGSDSKAELFNLYGSTTYCNFYSHVKYSPLASSVRVIYVAFCCYTAPDIQPFFD